MILIDYPKKYQVKGLMRGRPFTSSHMISSLPGSKGTDELIEFAKLLGMKPEWLQKEDTKYEHFDVFNSVYDKALKLGAKKMTPEKFVEIIRKKGDRHGHSVI